jgi:hypothetical protein
VALHIDVIKYTQKHPFTHTYTHAHTHIHSCTHTHTHTHTYVSCGKLAYRIAGLLHEEALQACKSVLSCCIYVWVHRNTHGYVCMYVCMYVCVRVECLYGLYIFTNTHSHTLHYTRTRTQSLFLFPSLIHTQTCTST